MKFFTADDFAEEGYTEDGKDIAKICNEKLVREAKVVYGLKSTKLGDEFYFSESKDDADTHRALLVCIEEIDRKPCEHVPARNAAGNYEPACYKCNAKLKPTGWEVVDD